MFVRTLLRVAKDSGHSLTKPVDPGLLDVSNAEAQPVASREKVRLGRRLPRHIYLGDDRLVRPDRIIVSQPELARRSRTIDLHVAPGVKGWGLVGHVA
jgi:aminoglycoside phosphotransferase family enzyme